MLVHECFMASIIFVSTLTPIRLDVYKEFEVMAAGNEPRMSNGLNRAMKLIPSPTESLLQSAMLKGINCPTCI